MRELKFRCWDDKIKKFTYFDIFSAMGMIPYDCRENIQQFTGLLDKYGVEIYEGDIIKEIFNNHYWINLIECIGGQFGNQLFSITYKDNLSESEDEKFYSFKERILDAKLRKYIPSGKSVNIIGNIFENPDLLK